MIQAKQLTQIQFVIQTGNDDAGGGIHGSSQTADVLIPGGGMFTVTLRRTDEPHWDNWSTHTVTLPIPDLDNNNNPITLTETHGITGVIIHLIQDNPDISADYWDIAALSISLFNDPSQQVCQLNLIGNCNLQDGSTGLVRLTKSAGASGTGPSWQYTIDNGAGPDASCPPAHGNSGCS